MKKFVLKRLGIILFSLTVLSSNFVIHSMSISNYLISNNEKLRGDTKRSFLKIEDLQFKAATGSLPKSINTIINYIGVQLKCGEEVPKDINIIFEDYDKFHGETDKDKITSAHSDQKYKHQIPGSQIWFLPNRLENEAIKKFKNMSDEEYKKYEKEFNKKKSKLGKKANMFSKKFSEQNENDIVTKGLEFGGLCKNVNGKLDNLLRIVVIWEQKNNKVISGPKFYFTKHYQQPISVGDPEDKEGLVYEYEGNY